MQRFHYVFLNTSIREGDDDLRKNLRLFSIFILLFFLLFSVAAACAADGLASGDTIVYVTKTGTKYHAGHCGYLKKSKYQITLKEAKASGYTPCSKCSPPQ